MTNPSELPISASRFLVRSGYWITALMAVGLLGAGLALAFGWPNVIPAALEKESGFRLADLQPWFSLILFCIAVMLALAARMFSRLSTILAAVSQGDPFTRDNSRRLRHIGWLVIAMQLLGAAISWLGDQLPASTNLAEGFGFSFTGLLAALLAFVVAQLFEQARAMHEELEGTV